MVVALGSVKRVDSVPATTEGPNPPRDGSRSWREGRRLLNPVGLIWVGVWVGLLAATATLGFATLFSTFAPTDDEGYFLITIKGYLGGADLYDQTFGPYGPFYFEFMAGMFKVLGLAVTNDAGRMITLYIWLAATLLLAAAAYRLSWNPLIAAFVYVIAFWDLASVPNEPTHPSHLLMLLLAAMVATAAFITEQRPHLAFTLLGAVAAAALLSKLNIGAFAIASLGFAAILASPRLARFPGLVYAVSACFVLLPIALMTRHVIQPGYIVYAGHVLLGALAVALVALGSRRLAAPDSGSASWLVYAAAGAVGLTALVCGIMLVQGTSLSGLAHGTILDAISFKGEVGSALVLPGNVIPYDAVGVAVAASVALGALPRSRPWPTVGALGRIAAGIWIWAAVLSPQPLAVPVALAWVAAVPASHEAPTPARRFVRLFVPALAVLQVLHAFPVAGSQIRFAAFLLVAVGAVCIGDGLAELNASRLGLGRPTTRLVAAGAFGLAIWLGFTSLILPLRNAAAAYHAGTSIRVAGATRIRVPAGTAHELAGVVTTLRERCKTFITMPGLGSLYLMAQQTPPTWKNSSGLPWAWSNRTQQGMVNQLRDVPGLCAVRYPGLEAWWSQFQGRPIPEDWPLRRFILNDFTMIATIDYMTVLERKQG
jgi:hypothetical protein